jgi:hypothetical protein
LAVQHPKKLLDTTDFFTVYSASVWFSILSIFLFFCLAGCLIWVVERWLKMHKNVVLGDVSFFKLLLFLWNKSKISVNLATGPAPGYAVSKS